MRITMPVLILLIAFASISFAAQSDNASVVCGENCCQSFSGTWNSLSGTCSGLNSSDSADYLECKTTCAQYASGGGCCGPAFILAGVFGAAFMMRRSP